MRRSTRRPPSCRTSRTTWAPSALAILSAAPIAQPAAANQDCSIGRDGWDDIQQFRRCLEEYHLDRWGDPWLLHRASRLTGNPTIVHLLLQEGWDPGAPDDDGLTPLHEGARNSNPTVVSHLLDAGAQLNTRDNEGYTPLHWAAAQSGNGRVVKVLLDRGADPFAESNDGRTPLHSALRYRADPSVVSRMLEAGASEHLTPLQLAVLEGEAMAVRRLVAEGADPNETDRYGWGALHFAVPLGGMELVTPLLGAGADPDARTVGGATALHLAASQAPESVVSALLDAGAGPNAKDVEYGRSPLHYAARFQEEALLPVITALLRAGADPGSSRESIDDCGLSPLHRVLMNGEVTAPVVKTLLEAGADPMARSDMGNTPLHIAAERAGVDAGLLERELPWNAYRREGVAVGRLFSRTPSRAAASDPACLHTRSFRQVVRVRSLDGHNQISHRSSHSQNDNAAKVTTDE